MSRRKDRERFLDKKHRYPEYVGFRGHNSEPDRRGQGQMQSVTCSVCGRRRNVPLGVALESGGEYVCMACQQAGADDEDQL